jgi:DNA-binding Xre family transcriptional regulator
MPKKNSTVVIFRLSEILAERKISQREAARLTGISKNGISVLAGDPDQIKLPTIAKLCAGLGVTPADLFSVAPAPVSRRA